MDNNSREFIESTMKDRFKLSSSLFVAHSVFSNKEMLGTVHEFRGDMYLYFCVTAKKKFFMLAIPDSAGGLSFFKQDAIIFQGADVNSDVVKQQIELSKDLLQLKEDPKV